MGNCCGGGESHQDRQPINEERQRLLGPAPITTSTPIDTTDYGATSTPSISKNDEQSQLSRILHQTANNVIDVSAVEPHSMGEQEYRDRQRQYNNRMLASSTGNHIPRNAAGKADFPTGQPAPVEALCAPPVPVSDVRFMHGLTSSVSDALGNIAVKSTEPIVVQF